MPINKIPELHILFMENEKRKEKENKYRKEKDNAQKFAQAAEYEKKRAERAEKELREKKWEIEKEERNIQEQKQKRNTIKRNLIIQIVISAVLFLYLSNSALKMDFWDSAFTTCFSFLVLAFTVNRIYYLLHFNYYYKKIRKKRGD
jgi:cation transport ATPase